jgi:hypothetical protein
VQNLGDERQAPASILAGIDELLDLVAKLRSGIVANEATRAAQNISVAQVVDFRLDFFDATPQPTGQS